MASSITVDRNLTTKSSNKITTGGTGNLGTYAASGIAVTANQCGLGKIDSMEISPAAGYVFQYIKATGMVWAWEAGADAAPLDEVGSTDISAAIFNWRATGY